MLPQHDRRNSREVFIGNIPMGGNNPVRLQSMTKTDTRDVQATLKQCRQALDAGADYIRISVPDVASVKAFEKIKNKLAGDGYRSPLIADIHYRHDLAIMMAGIADKLRINPANFGWPPESKKKQATKSGKSEIPPGLLAETLAPLAEACKKHGTAIRLGGNAGSVEHTNTLTKTRSAEFLVNQAVKYLDILEELGFYDLVVSLKNSNPAETTEATRLMHQRMQQTGQHYPLHIGVTESGLGVSGRVSSALGIIPLLREGIADTIRVSLTEEPEKEIHFAQKLLDVCRQNGDNVFEATCRDNMLYIISRTSDPDTLIAEAVQGFLTLPERNAIQHITIEAPGMANQQVVKETAAQIMQQADIKEVGTRFISCPACARTSTDMEKLCRLFRKELADYPGIHIAIMGCMVNGPGEMAGADYGVIATSNDKVNVYAEGVCIKRNICGKEAISLIREILIEDDSGR